MTRLGVIFLLFAWSTCLANDRVVPSCVKLISEKSLDDLARELHGGNPLHPSRKSLLGQYLKLSGAASAIKRFKKDKYGHRGPEKLVVAVGPNTFKLFSEMFGENFPNLLEHLHTPEQGSFKARWMTQVFSSATPHGTWRFPEEDSIGPMILLSDSEVARLHDYFRLNSGATRQTMFRCPDQIPGYHYPKDAYSGNCTTWFGHIPLGDKTHRTVTVAGSVDTHGDRLGKEARTDTLTDYVAPQFDEATVQLMKKVWSPDLHERLWDLLGIKFRLANHTNPGWVALSLTGLVGSDRVPFVAYYTSDPSHIPAPFNAHIELVGG